MKKDRILLIIILLLALFLRLNTVNWDADNHLHPDERFLTMVGNAVRLPSSIGDYLDPSGSTANPANVGFPFFVYGLFPILLNKVIAFFLHTDTYNAFTLQGRVVTGVLDTILVFVIYKTVAVWEKEAKGAIGGKVKLWAAFLYATMVFPIQLSHFFTTDIHLTFFSFLSFSSIVFYSRLRKVRFLLGSAICFGLALGSKINAVFLYPLLAYEGYRFFRSGKVPWRDLVLKALLFFAFAYLTVRLVSPYYFQNGNVFDPTISKTFLDNLKSLKSFEGEGTWFPPAIQWISKPKVLFTLQNLVFFGLGAAQALLVLIGLGRVFLAKKKHDLFFVALWVISLTAYHATQFVQTMRYLIVIYPFLAILAAIGAGWLFKKLGRTLWGNAARVGMTLLLLAWPFAFISIYFYPHSRVQASRWIEKHVPEGSIILGEYWDDPLPISTGTSPAPAYTVRLLNVFDQDGKDKWDKLSDELAGGDYYVLSSNRAWGSIMPLPEKYPRMSAFYEDLFSGKTSYQKVAEFTSYPSLRYLGIPIDFPDHWAEEAFTVYDHPQVLIFKRK